MHGPHSPLLSVHLSAHVVQCEQLKKGSESQGQTDWEWDGQSWPTVTETNSQFLTAQAEREANGVSRVCDGSADPLYCEIQ